MDVRQAYNRWADQYDNNNNKTRDLEAVSLRSTLSNILSVNCLEIGCGTGKNTEWLASKAQKVMAIDLSEEMLSRARIKVKSSNVTFVRADISGDWSFTDQKHDLVTFSLVLEHIEDLNQIFKKLRDVVTPGGYVYIGELHPFKQYNGTKARFETHDGVQVVKCFNHHVSDFTQNATKNDFKIAVVNEYFDDKDHTEIPRILTLLLQKNG